MTNTKAEDQEVLRHVLAIVSTGSFGIVTKVIRAEHLNLISVGLQQPLRYYSVLVRSILGHVFKMNVEESLDVSLGQIVLYTGERVGKLCRVIAVIGTPEEIQYGEAI